MPRVSVTLITYNESVNLAAALESVAWADERLVVDAESTDATREIAARLGARVVVHAWPGFASQKNHAAGLAANDWILSLDADERVTPELADEIRRTLESDPGTAGYRIPRVSWYLGRWIRCTDWFPDWQLRLYDRRRASWAERLVHESVRTDGAIGRLHGELQHVPYDDLSDHCATIDRYTTLAAAQMAADGRRAGALSLVSHPLMAFFRNYVLKRGFSAGTAGLVVSVMNSWYVFLKLAKRWELERRD